MLRLALAGLVFFAARADACELVQPRPHSLDPDEMTLDTTPPATPVVAEVAIRRGTGPDRSGCNQSSSSCDDLGSVLVRVSATDDRSAPDDLGWRVEVVAGVAPEGAFLPDYDYRGETVISWIDGASDDQEAISFTLRVTAIDLAGNESAPVDVLVEDDGSGGGCRAVPRPHGLAGLAGLLAPLALLARRRRARPRSH